MEVLYTHCAGLDVHKDSVVACARRVVDGRIEREVRSFSTTTSDLLALSAWLASLAVAQVAMEATGVYWKPIWNILDDGEFALTLANAKHVKNVPGRKTDVNDATWLADLLAHGLIRASFVPDRPTMETRTLLRTRKQMTRERTRHVQRLQKTLEEANIKLDSVITDVVGKTGRAMIEAMIAGVSDPAKLALLADRRIKVSPQTLREALRGRVNRHHRFLLRLHLDQIDVLDRALAEIDKEIDAGLDPFRPFIPLLTSIPGIAELSARVVLAEIGTDMRRFPDRSQSRLVGGAVPQERRERRQAPIDADAQGRSLAEDHAHPVRLGGVLSEGELPQSTISPAEGAAGWQEGGRRGRRIDADRHLAHAARRHILSGSRRRPLQAPIRSEPSQAPRRQARRARLQGPTLTVSRLTTG
jgi:transposase